MTLNYREETELETLMRYGAPVDLAEHYLTSLHAKLEQVGEPLERFWGWSQDELCNFFGHMEGWAASVILAGMVPAR